MNVWIIEVHCILILLAPLTADLYYFQSPDKLQVSSHPTGMESRASPSDCRELNFESDDWDEEGKLLFEWTQELNLDPYESSSFSSL